MDQISALNNPLGVDIPLNQTEIQLIIKDLEWIFVSYVSLIKEIHLF